MVASSHFARSAIVSRSFLASAGRSRNAYLPRNTCTNPWAEMVRRNRSLSLGVWNSLDVLGWATSKSIAILYAQAANSARDWGESARGVARSPTMSGAAKGLNWPSKSLSQPLLQS